MSDKRFRQIWQADPARTVAEDARPGFLDVIRFNGVSPLDDGPGARDADVPPALQNLLFGQAGATPIHSYALLDASRVPGLPELLETSRLEHKCLFRGDRDGIGQSAPWLIRLKENDKFTRNLFRQSQRSWHLWARDCGIFLRSGAGLDDLVAHFRRFIKLRDRRGRMVFFRFWDPVVAGCYFPDIATEPDRLRSFFRLSSGEGLAILAQTEPDAFTWMAPAPDLGAAIPARPAFDASDEQRFAEIAFLVFARPLSDWLAQEYPDRIGALPPAERQAIARHVIAAGRRAGLTMREDFAFLAQMMMTSGGWFLDDGYPAALSKLIADTPSPKAQALADAYAGMQRDTLQGQLFAQWAEVRAYLADLPADQTVTPARFSEFAGRFLRLSADDIPAAIASTRARLRELGIADQRTEGKAVVLCLALGPRFFEDPLKPWSGMKAEAAIQNAWQAIIA